MSKKAFAQYLSWIASSIIGMSTLMTPGTALAETASPGLASGFSWAYLSKLMIALIFVLLFFFFFAWLMRRSQTVGRSNTDGLSVVASLSLGTRERLVVVQAGDSQVLLGITPTQINSLIKLDNPLALKSATNKDSFQFSLDKIIQKQTGKV